jgi:glycosyltransferase involved in cell wall biosynthesis
VWRRWTGRHPTGIDRVCLAYLRHYGADAQAVVQQRGLRRILDRRSSTALFALLAQPRIDFRSALVAAVIRYGARRGCSGRGRLYLNIGHTGLNDPRFRAWLIATDVRPVYFVHDLIPLTHPEFCRAGERDKHRERIRSVLDTAVGVIANSQATLEELAAFGRTEELRSPSAIAALLGSDALRPTASVNIGDRPTFVILGTIEARKNHLMLLHVWSRLVSRLGADAPRLLVIGQRGWESEQAFDLLDRSELLKETVTEIGRCDDELLARHLAGARALLFPSLVEGYGLPLVEALRAKVPVIASDLPVFREIAGDVPDYLDPLNGPAWERAIMAYAQDDAARNEQLRRLEHYHPPTWEDHYAVVSPWLATL